MRVLFTFIGGLGHLHPLVPVARAIAAAGHEVAVAGSGRLVPDVEALGFRAFGTSPPRSADESPPARSTTPPDPADARAAELEFAENFADKGARRHADAVLEICRTWQPDVLVRDEADLGSAIAAEVLGIPCATVLVLAAGTLIRPELVRPRLDVIREEHGLAPDPDLRMPVRQLVLSPFPLTFRSPEAPLALPADTVAYRPGPTPMRPARSGDRSRVYVTLGTVFGPESGDLFERILAAVADLDADVLMTVGRHISPADLGDQPDHVRVERFVPQAEVLPRTDLVVSHGGSGALMGALAHGLPSVLLPLGADQPHNAVRAADLGLARVLDASTSPPSTIADAITAALADERMAGRTRAMADEFAALPDVATTVPVLERLAPG